MSATSEVCLSSGIYQPECAHARDAIVIAEGEHFPPCERCDGLVTWTKTYPTTNETWTVFHRETIGRPLARPAELVLTSPAS